MRPAASPAARSDIAGRRALGCSAWKLRATGRISAAATPALVTGFGNDSHIDAFGLFTGQVGYAINNVLLYVKGGAAVTDDRFRNYVVANNVPVTNQLKDTRWGGTIGVGVEYGFSPNWSAAIAYDHLFMGAHTYTFVNNGNGGVGFPAGTVLNTDRIRQDVDLVTVRVNYRWGGPVVAKY